jgi:hypothetical protein
MNNPVSMKSYYIEYTYQRGKISDPNCISGKGHYSAEVYHLLDSDAIEQIKRIIVDDIARKYCYRLETTEISITCFIQLEN